jgi:hypothetical protein
MPVWITKCPVCRRKISTVPCNFCGSNDYSKSFLSTSLVCRRCGRSFVKGLVCPNDGNKIEWWKLRKQGFFS